MNSMSPNRAAAASPTPSEAARMEAAAREAARMEAARIVSTKRGKQARKEQEKAELIGRQKLEAQALQEKTERIDPKIQTIDLTSLVQILEKQELDEGHSINLEQDEQEQRIFDYQLTDFLRAVSVFQRVFSKDNELYSKDLKEKNLEKPEVRENYRLLRETEQPKYSKISMNYDVLKQIYEKRIAALLAASKRYLFEYSLLDAIIVGSNSYRVHIQFLAMKVDVDTKFGSHFRLQEAAKYLEERKATLELKEEKPANIEPYEIRKSSETAKKIAAYSKAIHALKERVNVFNEALKSNSSEMQTSKLPEQYYFNQLRQLNALKSKLDDIEQEKNDRITALEQAIKREKGNPKSIEYLSAAKEKAKIEAYWEMLGVRYKEIQDFLKERKDHFKIKDEPKESNKVSASASLNEAESNVEEGDEAIRTASPDCQEALNLLNGIVSTKQHIVLGNRWEVSASMNRRRQSYFNLSNKLAKLKESKERFESSTLPARLKTLQTAISTYQAYIENMRKDIETIDKHFQALAKDAGERANWLPAEKKGFFGWFGGSSEKKPPEKSEKPEEKK